MQNYRPQGFSALPLVIKNILILNVIMFVADAAASHIFNIDLSRTLGLHYPQCDNFKPLQFISYMFMHGSFSHIFFNMFALWMFGKILEDVWGPKRFFVYYMVTGIGAGLTNLIITYLRIKNISAEMTPEMIEEVMENGLSVINRGMNYTNEAMAQLNMLINSTTIGASGAVFGILLAFGMMFPNSMLYIYFAIPIKAKWFVLLYGAIELIEGVVNSAGDNVAHFAHLGGMIFGFFLIKYWQKNLNNNFYN